MKINRGDIFLTNLEPVIGSEQGGIRPVLIIQNNISNKHSPVAVIAALTSKIYEKDYLTNVYIKMDESGLEKDSTVLLNQLRTIDKTRIIKKVGSLNKFLMNKVDNAIKICLDLK